MEFEKLGAFYLGKEYDLAAGRLLDRLVMYDARDLTTHAVCVGMTGSGKTGLCLGLLEEAAIDRVPAIIIDPKGDITNLMLTFPELTPDRFRPWINQDDARRKNLSPDDFAAQQAETWKKGLAEWGQDGERIRRLRESADFAIYTPGSESGMPVSILQSFAAPALDWSSEAELLRERIQGTVGALLGLVGLEADPVKSREHILLVNLFEHFWRAGEDVDLPKLILAIQEPPVRRLGVFDVDTFFPKKDRLALAMSLNNIIAAPSFAGWLAGQPLEINGFLADAAGRPRHSIFYIAHLSDAERMFFVTMLLNQVISWMRSQPGTTSLRAILYMDEIFGFFPPVADPPSKKPMLTLLKQARAFGLGVVLTTQNPVDLDYKGLANAGTWFIGRLQTERDKLRVLDGLESASGEAGKSLNRSEIDRLISSLGNRVFLLHNVHAEGPVVFQTRWAMSYLRGPLTRDQIRTLMAGRPAEGAAAAPSAAREAGPAVAPPSLPPDVRQVYLRVRRSGEAAAGELEAREGVKVSLGGLVYTPGVLGAARVRYVDRKVGLDRREDVNLLAAAPAGLDRADWEKAVTLALAAGDLQEKPQAGASFEAIPGSLNEAADLIRQGKELGDHLLRTRSLALLYSPALKLYSQPGESERDFVVRLTQAGRELRDGEVDRINDKYADRLAKLEDRLRRAEAAKEKKQADAKARQTEVLISVGESLLGMFMGRRSVRSASTAMGKYRMSRGAGMGAEAAAEEVEALRAEAAKLEEELKKETEAVAARWDGAPAKVETVPVRPGPGGVTVDMTALAWTPFWRVSYRDSSGIDRAVLSPAY